MFPTGRQSWLLLALLAAALSAGVRTWSHSVGPLDSREVVMPRPTAEASPFPPLRGSLPRAGRANHAASLARLQDGSLVSAWFAGTREGARDVAIYLSRFQNGTWTPPVKIADPGQTTVDTARFVRKLGNPVLGVGSDNRLHLWYVGAVGGWATSSINHRVSADGGITWSKAERLVTAPVANISTLVRTAPLPLNSGGFILPVYHQLLTKHGEVLRLDREGNLQFKQRFPAGRRILQPAIAALPEEGRLLALMRDVGRPPRRIAVVEYRDQERTWRQLPPLDIPNPNSSVALLRLHDGRLLLACNPLNKVRNRLSLWLSNDHGSHWNETLVLENMSGADDKASYPTLLQEPDGRIHLVYSWQQREIRHWILSPSSLTNRTEVSP